ncbi:MAG: hypothetical protein LBV43_02320 [Prevotella sp.]|nr:hypothetical protein [Prevotella sp.]
MEEFMALLIPIIAIICIFGLPVIFGAYVLIKLITSNNKERLELAKHGIVAPQRVKPAPNKYRSLRNGIISIGIALGLIIGIIAVVKTTLDYYVEFLVITSSTIMFMGIAYVVFYLIVKDKKELDNDAE